MPEPTARTPGQPRRTADQPRRTPQRAPGSSYAAAAGRSAPSEGSDLREELRALPVAELRRRCATRGVSTHGLLEKEEFVAALLAAGREEPAVRGRTAKGRGASGPQASDGTAAEVRVRRISEAANLDVEL
jgi:hypothetical protein